MRSKRWYGIVVIVLVALVILVSLLAFRFDGGDDGERSKTMRGEVTGNLTASGRMWSNESFPEHPLGITIYRGPSSGDGLRGTVTHVSSVTVNNSTSDEEVDGTYHLEDQMLAIVSDFERTSEATIVTWLEDYESYINYSVFNGTMTEDEGYWLDIEYELVDVTGRIIRGPHLSCDILVYDVTLVLGNRTLHVERAELSFPDGVSPDVLITAKGKGDMDHMPDVMVEGSVRLDDFMEEVGLGPVRFEVVHVTYRADLIRIRTIQEPDYFNEPVTPWIIELRITRAP